MTRLQSLLEEIKKGDTAVIEYWETLSKSKLFRDVLVLASESKGIYNPAYQESEHPHIQSSREGGNKGWNKLITVLLSPKSLDEIISTKPESTEDDYNSSIL